MRQRWRLLRLRIHIQSEGWAAWYGFWTVYWPLSGLWHALTGQWWAVPFYILATVWYARRLGQELGLVERHVTATGILRKQHGPIYPGRAAIEEAVAKGCEAALEADPKISTRPEPDFALDFGYTRERKPHECPTCDRPLEGHDLRGPDNHFELLVCYGGRPAASILRHLPVPSGHHYEYQMGPFRNEIKRRRAIALPKLVLAPRPVAM